MGSFRTVELSDNRYENDGLRFMTVKTDNLKGRGDLCLYVPKIPEGNSELPIHLLLHGVYGSSWSWALNGGVHKTAKRLMDSGKIKPVILAMPSDGLWGDGSAYHNHNSKNFANWIVQDVPKAIKENIPEAGKNSSLCIAGLSMGGYGALHLGAAHPLKFKAISAHSAITSFEDMQGFVEEPLASYGLGNIHKNVIEGITANKSKMPPLRFDCGIKDSLLSSNRNLHEELLKLNLHHVYEEFDGGHNWSYWQKHVERTLRFFNDHV